MNPRSRIADRYNGFLLGFSLHVLRFEFASTRYADYRTRIHDVLSDLGIRLALPADHAEFVASADDLVRELLLPLKAGSRELIDFYSLGFHTLRLMIDGDDAPRECVEDFREIAETWALDAAWLRRRLRNPELARKQDEELVAELMSTAYEIAGIAVGALDPEPDAAFMITPFGPPVSAIFPVFHTRALELAGYHPIRAWVGLTNEFYLNMLYTLIGRCGVAVADLSPAPGQDHPNLNVLHEIGLAQGLGKHVFFLIQTPGTTLPSNLIGSAIIEYEPGGEGWPEEHAVATANAILHVEGSYRAWARALTGEGAERAREAERPE